MNRIVASVAAPGRVAGMHFFSPAHVMRLVEIVRADATSPSTLATVLDLSQRLGKIGVVVGVGDGFVGNRMLYAYRRQADFLLEEGALPEQVDRALRDFGFPMGPFEMNDLAGLDISWRIRKRQAASARPACATRRSRTASASAADSDRRRARAGIATSRAGRDPRPDPEVTALIEGGSRELGIERRPVADAEVVERCLSALVNEGFRTLDEGLAARPGDIDVIWVHGYGFPRARGGPMFHAEERWAWRGFSRWWSACIASRGRSCSRRRRCAAGWRRARRNSGRRLPSRSA